MLVFASVGGEQTRGKRRINFGLKFTTIADFLKLAYKTHLMSLSDILQDLMQLKAIRWTSDWTEFQFDFY